MQTGESVDFTGAVGIFSIYRALPELRAMEWIDNKLPLFPAESKIRLTSSPANWLRGILAMVRMLHCGQCALQ